jgi:hypothetical protein
MYTLCKYLAVYFSLQIKNKSCGGTAFPAFILAAGMVANRTDLKHCVIIWFVGRIDKALPFPVAIGSVPPCSVPPPET